VLTESGPQLHGAGMSTNDHTLDALLLDHLQDLDLPTILTRLADRLEPYCSATSA